MSIRTTPGSMRMQAGTGFPPGDGGGGTLPGGGGYTPDFTGPVPSTPCTLTTGPAALCSRIPWNTFNAAAYGGADAGLPVWDERLIRDTVDLCTYDRAPLPLSQFQGGPQCSLASVRISAGNYWEYNLWVPSGGGDMVLWVGRKWVGSSPLGFYSVIGGYCTVALGASFPSVIELIESP